MPVVAIMHLGACRTYLLRILRHIGHPRACFNGTQDFFLGLLVLGGCNESLTRERGRAGKGYAGSVRFMWRVNRDEFMSQKLMMSYIVTKVYFVKSISCLIAGRYDIATFITLLLWRNTTRYSMSVLRIGGNKRPQMMINHLRSGNDRLCSIMFFFVRLC